MLRAPRAGGSSAFTGVGWLRFGHKSEDSRYSIGEKRLRGAVLTWVKIFLNQLHLELEDLLLQLADGVLHLLPPGHHVAEISDLQRHQTGSGLGKVSMGPLKLGCCFCCPRKSPVPRTYDLVVFTSPSSKTPNRSLSMGQDQK